MNQIEHRLSCMSLHVPYGMERLLSLMYVVETTAVKTAAVPLYGEPRILINPDFVQKHCPTDEHLFMLILHELHHVLLGHTRLYKRVSPAQNLAFDAIINAMLCRQLPDPCFTALFRESYPADQVPFCLLRPPEGFPNTPQYPSDLPMGIVQTLNDLYYNNTGTFHDIFEQLPAMLPKALSGLFDILDALFGSHDEDSRGLELGDDPDMLEIVREIVEQWPMPKDPIIGRSMSEILTDLDLDLPPPCPPHTFIKNVLLRVAQKGKGVKGAHHGPKMKAIQQVWPTKDRRAFAVLASGKANLLYHRQIRQTEPSMKPIHIYVDVSGSMNAFRPDLIRAVISCRHWLSPQIFLFSTEVVPTTIEELDSGRIQTTGGTSGMAVVEHIIEHKIEHAVVFTDGYVGPQDPSALKHAQKPHIVLTPGGYLKDLESIAASVVYLPHL